MPDRELFDALDQLEAALRINAPIGAVELPPELRYFRVLAEIRSRLCPQVATIVDFARTPSGEIAAILTDTLIATIGNLPVPIATLSKHLATLGAERFCRDQSILFRIRGENDD